ncbi:MAG: hypothetical protein FJ102_22370 [Deltaproteobacteria bacterium]|nr:hypothetical protein [Deltaproteobacteria bacterium]
MWWLLACDDPPSADALLREGKIDEAIARAGVQIDPRRPSVQALARRARHEDWISFEVLVDMAAADVLLSGAPMRKLEPVELAFDAWTPLAPCTAARLGPGWRVAVGRTELPGDPDPAAAQGAFEGVPYDGGRIACTAADAAGLAACFARLDRDPPVRRVTAVLAGGAAPLSVHLSRHDGAWWTVSASDAEGAVAWLGGCSG